MALEFETIARKHFGEPNKAQSSKRELRFGTNGSVSVNLEKGEWYDHEINKGGHLSALERNDAHVHHLPASWQNSNGKSSSKPCSGKPFHIVKTWSYVDEFGAELFEVCRKENGEIANGKPQKQYFQRHKNPSGAYVNNVDGIRQVPYRLPELIRAVEQGQIIFITEGEKCSDAVIALGGAATCNAMGAGKWPDDKLQGIASHVRILQLPSLSHKGDIIEWIEAGGTLEQLYALVETVLQYKTENSADGPLPLFPPLPDAEPSG